MCQLHNFVYYKVLSKKLSASTGSHLICPHAHWDVVIVISTYYHSLNKQEDDQRWYIMATHYTGSSTKLPCTFACTMYMYIIDGQVGGSFISAIYCIGLQLCVLTTILHNNFSLNYYKSLIKHVKHQFSD